MDLVRQPSEALVAFVPPMSVEDRPLLWMVVRSQTYYPKHILMGAGRSLCSCRGFQLFLDRLIRGEER